MTYKHALVPLSLEKIPMIWPRNQLITEHYVEVLLVFPPGKKFSN